MMPRQVAESALPKHGAGRMIVDRYMASRSSMVAGSKKKKKLYHFN